jgi:hypothetical protein
MNGRRRGLLAAAAILLLVVGAAYWTLENPPMDEIDVQPPAAEQLEAVAGTRIFFGHQSVGANVLSGVEDLYAESTTRAPRIVETTEPPAEDGGFIAHAYLGVNGDPHSKIAEFTRILDGPMGERVDVALLKFCYLDVTASSDVPAVFDAYAHAMSELAWRHPDIRFLYTTVPLTTDPSWRANLKALVGRGDQAGPLDNLAREEYNELIRERYGASGALFDVAAVEATLAQRPTSRAEGADRYFVLNRALAADSGHLNALGARAAAGELVRVIAPKAP